MVSLMPCRLLYLFIAVVLVVDDAIQSKAEKFQVTLPLVPYAVRIGT